MKPTDNMITLTGGVIMEGILDIDPSDNFFHTP